MPPWTQNGRRVWSRSGNRDPKPKSRTVPDPQPAQYLVIDHRCERQVIHRFVNFSPNLVAQRVTEFVDAFLVEAEMLLDGSELVVASDQVWERRVEVDFFEF